MATAGRVDGEARELTLVLPRLVGRLKRLPLPEPLQSLELTPRHVSLLSMLLHDGPLGVSELAQRLSVAPTTVSLVISELTRKRVLRRDTDEADRRRRIVDLDDDIRPAVARWLAPLGQAWQEALDPLTPDQRRLIVDTLLTYEAAFTRALDDAASTEST